MNRQGRYRIQAVADITGVSPATLRAWERRYGVPSPVRTPSSYRLYSDRDVGLVTRIVELSRRGVAVAEAARQVLRSAEEEHQPPPLADDPFDLARDRILDAVQRYEIDDLERCVRQAILLGSAGRVFDRVFLPVLHRVGELWRDGVLSIGQEHLLTEILSGFAREILRQVQPDGSTRRALLACVEGEQHALPLHVVAFHLAQQGHRTVILGPNTPPSAIKQAVEAMAPDLVGLSVTHQIDPARAAELMDGYAEACDGTPWIVGGLGTGQIRQIIERRGGVVSGQDNTSLRFVLRQIQARRPAPPGAPGRTEQQAERDGPQDRVAARSWRDRT
jgi:DNA-binding transcriptional MerR regulator